MIQTTETIQPIVNDQSIVYTFDILQRSRLGSTSEEHKVQATVAKQYIRTTAQGAIYRMNVLDRQQTQSNFLRAIENDLSFLSQSIAVQTDATGEITTVLNLSEIREQWEDYRHTFYEKYKDEQGVTQIISDTDSLVRNEVAFTHMIKESETATVLFPKIYGQFTDINQSTLHQKEFTNFFGNTALPLALTTIVTQRKQRPNSATIVRKGELNEDHFKHEDVQLYFSKLLNNYNLKTRIDVNYIENYDLNDDYWITHATQIFATYVEGVFSFEQVVRVTQNTIL